MKEFAAYLRHERETRGVSLEKIQQQSRIRMQYLVAMESGRFDELPETTYVRAFLRHYATVVGLDADEVLQRYEDARAAAGIVVPERATAMPLAEESRSERRQRQLQARRRKRRLQWVGLFVVIALLILFRVWDPLALFHKDDSLQDGPPHPTVAGHALDEVIPAEATPTSPLLDAVVVGHDNNGDDAATHGHPPAGNTDVEMPGDPEDSVAATAAMRGTSEPDTVETEMTSALDHVEDEPETTVAADGDEHSETDGDEAVVPDADRFDTLEEDRRAWYDEMAASVHNPGSEPVVVSPYPGADAITITLHPVDEAWTELTVDDRRVVYRVLQAGEEVTFSFAQSARLRLGRAESTLVALGGESVGTLGAGIVSKHFIVSGVE